MHMNTLDCTNMGLMLVILSFSLLHFNLRINAQTTNTTFQVGVVLDFNSLQVGRIGLTSLSLAATDFYSVNRNYSTRLVLHVRDSGGRVTGAAETALSLLKDEVDINAIIGPQKSAQANFVIGLGDTAKVPILSFSATSPSLHPQTPYFVQTALSDAAQVDSIAAVVNYFGWSQVVLVYEDSDYGNGIIPYLSNAFQGVNARVSYRCVVPVSANDDFVLKELYKMKTMQTRVFLVHVSSSLASKFFPRVKEAEMLSEGFVWIATSGLMDLFYSLDSNIVDSMQGVIGVRPLVPRSRKLKSATVRWIRKFLQDNPGISRVETTLFGLWAYDTLWALATAAEKIGVKEPSSDLQNAINTTNMFALKVSKTGPKIQRTMQETAFQGLGGNFRLVNGQLEPSSFQIVNVVGNRTREVGIWTASTRSLSPWKNNEARNLTKIVWPGGKATYHGPKGWEYPLSGKILKIGVPQNAGFPEFVNVERDPRTNAPKVSGYIVEVFEAVVKELPYALRYEYVPFETTSPGSYNNLTFQVSQGVIDAAVGDITITASRSEFVDFTLPFEEGGITWIQKIEYEDPNDKLIFTKPFTRGLWLTAIALFIFTGMALWVLEHRINKAFRGPRSEHVGLILYVPFMSLVFSNRERIVSNLARLVLVVWVFVVLILSSTYTASLSARLTALKIQQLDTDVNALIKSGESIGCREGSFIVDYLRKLGFDKSKIKTYNISEDFNSALSRGSGKDGIKAFFSRTPYTDLFFSKYCNKYMRVGTPHFTQGFAFVFPKDSPIVADVSRVIIHMTDNGTKTRTKEKWIGRSSCIEDEHPDRLNDRWGSIGLDSFKILFGITAGITSTCLVVFLVTYLYQNRDSLRRISSSGGTTWSRIRAFGKHFDQRDPRSFRTGMPVVDEDGGNESPEVNHHHRSTVVSDEITCQSGGENQSG